MISKPRLAAFWAGAMALVLPLALPALAAAEELRLPLLSGGSFNLAATRGHVTVVNFWATWCPPCRAEIPVLNAFYRRHAGQLRMVGAATDVGRDRDKVVEMAHGIAYPVGMARDASENSFGSPGGLPVTFVLDSSGEIRATLRPTNGALTAQELEAAVAPLLGR